MTDLPRALAPWADELVGLDPELVGVLGEPLRRLTRFLGPAAAPRPSASGEPDGFAGIGRRGAWERPLLSEWAVAQVAPLEFLRRAVAGEQATLQLQRVDPSASSRCVVLLDAPPSQHGAPRLAQLAVLLVLAARARRGGLPLDWGLLQGRHLVDRVDVDALEAWRHGARWGEGTAADLGRWQEELGLDAHDELWLVGGPELPDGPRRVVVEAPLRADGKLSVRWEARTLWLDRVPVAEGTRLFRRPPRPRPARVHGVGAGNHTGRLWFGVSGDRLFVPTDTGSVIAYHVPNSPAAAAKGPGRPREIPGPDLLAAGYQRRKLLSVRRAGDALEVRPGGHVPLPIDFVAPERPVLARLSGRQLYLVDGAGQLWRFPDGELVTRGVLAFDRYQIVVHDDDGVPRRRWWNGSDGPPLPVSGVIDARVNDHGMALRTGPTTWWLEAAVTVPATALVAGVIFLDGRRWLLYWHDGTLWWAHEDERRPLVAASRVVDVAVHPTRPIVAYSTDDGGLCALHAPDGVELLRVSPPEAS